MLLFLLLGAMVNVGVAWGFALFVNTYKFESHDALDESHIAWWREHVPPGWKDAPGAVTLWPAIGADSYRATMTPTRMAGSSPMIPGTRGTVGTHNTRNTNGDAGINS